MKLTDAEVSRLSRFLGLSEFDFIQAYTRVRPDRRGLALQEKPNGDCILLDDSNCLVQRVKPQQCQEFPNGWSFPGFEKVCRATPRFK